MRILVTLLGRIGDMVLLTSFLDILNKKFPKAYIEVLASQYNHIILQNNPLIKKILIYDKKVLSSLKLIQYLLTNKFDIYIDPKDHYSRESLLLSKIVRANKKIGYNKPGSKNFDFSIPFYKKEENLHFTMRLYKSLEFLGIELPAVPNRPILFEIPDSMEYVNNFLTNKNLKSSDYKNIIINISASKPNKMWDNKKWVDLLFSVSTKGNFNYILTFEPKHRELAENIQKSFKEIILFHSRNFSDIISIIKFPDLIISTDTSIVHVAAAFNIPIIVLYAGMRSFSECFSPLSDIHIQCLAPENENNIANISVHEVMDAFSEITLKLNW